MRRRSAAISAACVNAICAEKMQYSWQQGNDRAVVLAKAAFINVVDD